MDNKKAVRPFGMRDKLGYLFGDFGNDFTFILSSSFLLKFYTDVMGINPLVVGSIMAAARIVDAFTDVTMGRICDKSKMTPVGKFKPWIRRMCGPVAISSFLIYQSAFADWSEPAKIAWLTVTYILWGSIFYTSVNIPYGSMASAISSEAGDRQSLSTFRSMGSVLAGVIVGAGVPLLAYTNDAAGNPVLDGGKFTVVAGIFSIGAVICYLLCYYLTTERVKVAPVEKEGEKNSIIGLFKRAFTNRSLLSIIAASIVMLLAQLTIQTMAGYVFPNFYRNTVAQSASTFFMMGGMTIAAIGAKPLAARFGKAEVAVFSNILAVAVNVVLFIVRPANVWVYSGFQFVSWLGLGMFTMVSWALITDVIDDMEVKNGIREDGSVYALYSWARKLGQAASASLTGALLSIIGYTEETAFEPAVTEGIFNISVIVPAIGFALLAVILWFWYPLHKKQVDSNITYLKEKHNNQ